MKRNNQFEKINNNYCENTVPKVENTNKPEIFSIKIEDSDSNISNEAFAVEDEMVPEEPPTYMDVGKDYSSSPIGNEQKDIDNDMYELLSSWGFVDLYEYFVSCKLNVNRLKIIDNEDIKELFTNKPIGVRVEFKHKLLEWRRENGFGIHVDIPEPILRSIKLIVEEQLGNINKVATPTISRTPSPAHSSNSSPALPRIGFNFNIDAILNEYPLGDLVLTEYKKNNRIGDSSRTILIDCISSWLLKNYKTVSRKEFSRISEQIQERFGENKNIYFDLPSKGTKDNPSGRLYSRFYNMKRRHRQIGIDFLEDKPSKKPNCLSFESEEPEVSLADVKWLQLNKDPWDETKAKWTKTHRIRQKDLHTLKFQEFLQNWPLLQDLAGIALIDLDFGILHPGKQNCLITKWDEFKSKIVPVFNEKVKDKNCLELLGNLNKRNFSKEPEDVLISLILPAILHPTSRQTTIAKSPESRKRRFFKSTIKDSQQTFIHIVTEANDFQPAIERLESKMKEHGQSLQPLIIFCLFNNSFTVYYNQIHYKFPTLLPALDTCLKMFFVLNLDYPFACKSVWIFIEKYFFDIDSKQRIPVDSLVLLNILKQR